MHARAHANTRTHAHAHTCTHACTRIWSASDLEVSDGCVPLSHSVSVLARQQVRRRNHATQLVGEQAHLQGHEGSRSSACPGVHESEQGSQDRGCMRGRRDAWMA